MMRSSSLWVLSLLLACQRPSPASPAAPDVSAPSGPTEAPPSGFSPFPGDGALSEAPPEAPTSVAVTTSTPSIPRPPIPPTAETTPRPAAPAKPAPSLKELGFRYETGHRGPGPHTGGFGLTMKGQMDPHLIQRIIRQNFGRFRLCYENGLRTDPNLQGRVTLRISITPDGSVSRVIDGGSDLPDPAVVACMISGARALAFPPPTRGPVEFFYPMMFSPGG